jgi:prepilin-type N-terminal cleavage/methylation domain-containing protein
VIKNPRISRLRRGFTLIELLVVITIILLISGLFLSLSPGDGGGLVGGQRMLTGNIRSLRAMALMNREAPLSVASSKKVSRYRLLILNDPTDPVNHLRQFVLAIGTADATSSANPSSDKYYWFSPEPPSNLPTGIFVMPPSSDNKTDVLAPVNPDTGSRVTLVGRRTMIGQIADNNSSGAPDKQNASPPNMDYLPTTQSAVLASGSDKKNWYYIELQGTGAHNHLGRVLVVLASASLRVDGNKAYLDIENENKFAALLVRPNGDVVLTSDADELTNSDALK